MKDFYINIKNLNSSMEQKVSHEDMKDFYINIKNLNSSMEQKLSHEDMQDFYLNIKNLNESIVQKVSYEDIDSLNNLINSKASSKDFELYMKSVGYAKDYMKLSQENIQTLINEVKKRLPPKKLLNKKELISIVEEEKYKFDSFYIEFEDKFRGSREDIKKRVEVYLPYIEKLSTIKDNIEILDVGCGRGEWLELLKENGYNKIKGIDINRIMVSKSQELGLDVKEYDVIEYLKSLESNSLSVITGFHIIEHLPFEILMKMFEESYRVLKKGGLVIFETPNPENLVVGAYTFYTDITHRNPIPFATSEFLIQYSGFTSTEIKRVNYSNIVEPLENKHLNHHLRTGEDYSIIGYKG
ncbi:hypothetical protein MNB_SV-15-1326 [hydrothermal vent metagenome]|uniref:Methyltransferase type 11 domain-containing protein n=1 Tax=hydrothermal vent metagenome TaxID=652676 RepID=A0A1W1EHV9_9ZZZZ